MSEIVCFLLVETNLERVALRRYRSSDTANSCPGSYGYHNAVFPIGDMPATDRPIGYDGDPPQDDPRWPRKCDGCDYIFQPDDVWQVSRNGLYTKEGTKELYTLSDVPVGAMWWSPWLTGHGSKIHQAERHNGPHLCVRTPGGVWDIDAGSSNGDGWHRTGDPPKVTATPSIICNDFHGWLRAGLLVPA